MSKLPPIVDDNFDIQLHGRQGATITIDFVNDDGSARDVSARTFMFECGTGVNITLGTGANSSQKIIDISNLMVKAIYAQKDRSFVVIDQSATQPTPIWVGTVYITGWVE